MREVHVDEGDVFRVIGAQLLHERVGRIAYLAFVVQELHQDCVLVRFLGKHLAVLPHDPLLGAGAGGGGLGVFLGDYVADDGRDNDDGQQGPDNDLGFFKARPVDGSVVLMWCSVLWAATRRAVQARRWGLGGR